MRPSRSGDDECTREAKRRMICLDFEHNATPWHIPALWSGTLVRNLQEIEADEHVIDTTPDVSIHANNGATATAYIPVPVADPQQQPKGDPQLLTQVQMQTERATAYDPIPFAKQADVTFTDLTNEIARLHEALHFERDTKRELSELVSNLKQIKKQIVTLDTKVIDRCCERISSPSFEYAAQLRYHGLRPDVKFTKRSRTPVSLSVKYEELSEELQGLRSTIRELRASIGDLQPDTNRE
jgi:hypothetical protein